MRSSTCTKRLALPLLLAALLTGCTLGDAGTGAPSSSPAPGIAVPQSAAPPAPGSGAAQKPSWQDAIARAVEGIDGAVSLAVAGQGAPTVLRGAAQPAWSTSKVPLAIAALVRSPVVTANVRAAIVESDNAAAEAIWSSLGTPDQAGAAVQKVLRDGGDAHTVVQTRTVRPEYTAFGQTAWADGDAAAFAARFPCTPAGAQVLTLMRQVAPNQQWGVYELAGAKSVGVKGGWGPGEDGRYLVRQLAVIETPRGFTGVMLSARPNDGTLASGSAALTRLAPALARHLAELPARRC